MSTAAESPEPGQTEPIALVTGASRGLGAALAEALSARGYHVVAVARTTGALEELDDRIQAAGGRATLAPIDITDDNALRHLCRSIHDRWGRVDLWAHTAVHAPPLAPAGHVAIKDLDRTLAVTARATGVLIPMLEPLLRAAADGAGVHSSGSHGTALFFDDPTMRDDAGATRKFWGSWALAKEGQMALARAWAAECAALGPARAGAVVVATPRADGRRRPGRGSFPASGARTLARPPFTPRPACKRRAAARVSASVALANFAGARA
jgi:NAD(P)-dependent dehydrogenase (short-subunit alcohol dehydrogenase family)